MEPDYENPWIFNGHPFLSEDINDNFGFVYRITNLLNGKEYIGRKYFWQLRKPRGGGRRVKSESNWKKYYGSSDLLNAERSEASEVTPFSDAKSSPYTPLKVVPTTKKHVSLFLNNVLSESLDDGTPKYYNSNILGRYYRKDYYEPE